METVAQENNCWESVWEKFNQGPDQTEKNFRHKNSVSEKKESVPSRLDLVLEERQCYIEMGILIPKTLAIWASPSHTGLP